MKKMFNHMEMGTFRSLMWLKSLNTPYVYFILRLKNYGKICQEEVDIEFAKVYNIPDCCRDFYILLKRHEFPPAEFMDTHFGKDSDEFKYVRCPKCRGINHNEFIKGVKGGEL